MRSYHLLPQPTNRLLAEPVKRRADLHKALRQLAGVDSYLIGAEAGQSGEYMLHLVQGVRVHLLFSSKHMIVTELEFGQFSSTPWWVES